MAKIYNPPRNSFVRAMARSAQNQRLPSESNKGSSSSTTGNPLLESGNPAFNQKGFSGPAASFAQLGQMLAQNHAFKQDQESLNEAMDDLGKRISGGSSPEKAFLEMLGENPGHFNTLSNAGVLQNTAALGQWMQQAQMASQIGQSQIIDLGGGHKMGLVVGPDGKVHQMNINPQSQSEHGLGVMTPQGPLVSGPGGTRPIPGGVPISSMNADTRNQINLNNKLNTLDWDPKTNTYRHKYINPAIQGNDAASVAAGATVTPPRVEAELKNNADKNYFSNVENLHRAVSDLAALSKDVNSVLTGKIRTFFAGKVLGTNDPGIYYNDALQRARAATAKMSEGGIGNNSRLQVLLGSLPNTWEAYSQAKTIGEGQLADLREEAANRASQIEVNNKKLPKANADSLARMGVFTSEYAPQIDALKNNPETVGKDAWLGMQPFMRYAPPDVKSAWIQRGQALAGVSAEQSTKPDQ